MCVCSCLSLRRLQRFRITMRQNPTTSSILPRVDDLESLKTLQKAAMILFAAMDESIGSVHASQWL